MKFKTIGFAACVVTACGIPALPALTAASYDITTEATDVHTSAPTEDALADLAIPATFDEAIEQCAASPDESGCIGQAQLDWCEFVPFTADSPHYREDIDGPCLAAEQEQEQVDADMAELAVTEPVIVPEPVIEPATEPLEDEPGWDCRTMGNADCGCSE
jgi:hypothetical protein